MSQSGYKEGAAVSLPKQRFCCGSQADIVNLVFFLGSSKFLRSGDFWFTCCTLYPLVYDFGIVFSFLFPLIPFLCFHLINIIKFANLVCMVNDRPCSTFIQSFPLGNFTAWEAFLIPPFLLIKWVMVMCWNTVLGSLNPVPFFGLMLIWIPRQTMECERVAGHVCRQHHNLQYQLIPIMP